MGGRREGERERASRKGREGQRDGELEKVIEIHITYQPTGKTQDA